MAENVLSDVNGSALTVTLNIVNKGQLINISTTPFLMVYMYATAEPVVPFNSSNSFHTVQLNLTSSGYTGNWDSSETRLYQTLIEHLDFPDIRCTGKWSHSLPGSLPGSTPDGERIQWSRHRYPYQAILCSGGSGGSRGFASEPFFCLSVFKMLRMCLFQNGDAPPPFHEIRDPPRVYV